MIRVILITGFLGAGKTSLMKQMLEEFQDKRIGVIINEFGDINIDAILVKRNGVTMAELSNGSIFCACIKDKFVDSLIEMSKQDLEYLFIEASGLADPANMAQILKGIEHKLYQPYFYHSAICIVDGETFLDLYDLLPAIHHQIQYSNAILINKKDLIDKEKMTLVTQKIKDINPNTSIFETSYCKIGIKALMDDFGQFCVESKDTTNTLQTRPKTFIVRGEQTLPMHQLQTFLQEITPSAYRIKGFVKTDQGVMQVSTVGNHIYLEEWNDEICENEIIIISSLGMKTMSIIIQAIDRNLKGLLHL